MKHTMFFSVVFALLMFLSPEVKSQIKLNIKEKINQEANTRANQRNEQAADAGFDKVEQGVKNVFKKKDKTGKDDGKSGDAVIFEDNLQNEENVEFVKI